MAFLICSDQNVMSSYQHLQSVNSLSFFFKFLTFIEIKSQKSLMEYENKIKIGETANLFFLS